MLTSMQKQSVCAELLRTIPDLMAIYVFGSQADGTAGPDSDTDLAILLVNQPDPHLAFALKSELSLIVGGDVDLVDLWRADTIIQAQVVAFGERLYADPTLEVDHFETTVFSKYALLNEERRDIVNDIVKRGSIRG